MFLESKHETAPEISDELVFAFLKERKNYKVWKSCDITWYYTTADIRGMFHKDNQALANRFSASLSRMNMWSLMRIVQFGDYFYGLNRHRKKLQFVLKVCSVCNWIEPHYHAPGCSVSVVESIMLR